MKVFIRSTHGVSTPVDDRWSRAACGSRDPTWWDLTARNRVLTARNQQALSICGSCPVREWCDGEAERLAEVGVIRGGRPRWPGGKPNSDQQRSSGPTPKPGCGTPTGIGQHRAAGELLCDPCRDARAEIEAVRRVRRRQGDPAFHGCPACDGLFKLTRAGLLHPHKGFSWTSGFSPMSCPGSGAAGRAVLLAEEGTC